MQKIWQNYPFLQRYFILSSHRVVPVYKPPRTVFAFKQQIFWYIRNYPEHLCLFEVGCYYVCFNQQACTLAAITGYKVQPKWRGFVSGCRFRKNLLPKVLCKLKENRLPVLVIRQNGRELYRAKELLPYFMIE